MMNDVDLMNIVSSDISDHRRRRKSSGVQRRRRRRKSSTRSSEGGKDQSSVVRIRHYIDEVESSFLSSSNLSGSRKNSARFKKMTALIGLPRHKDPSPGKQKGHDLPLVTLSPTPRRGSLFTPSPRETRRGSLFTPSPPTARRGSLLMRSDFEPSPSRWSTRSHSIHAWNDSGDLELSRSMLHR